MRRFSTRWAAAGLAATATLAMTAAPATAADAPADGPYVFDAAGSGQAVSVVVGLPQGLADGLQPAITEVPGVSLQDGELVINLANVLGELELPITGQTPGEVSAVAEATSLTGSLSGLVDQLTGGQGNCLDSPVDVTLPPDAETPLVSMQLLQAECVEDAAGRTTIASSRVADLEVSLAGAIALLPEEAAAPLNDAIDQISTEVTDQVLTPIRDDVLTPAQDAINENLGTSVDLSEAVRVPELVDLPLASIDLIESTTRNLTEGEVVRSVSTSTLTGASLLGTVCIPDTTYRTEAFATGAPGGNGYASEIPPIDLSICDTQSLSPILRLLDQEGVLGDVLVNTGDGELKPLSELLGEAGLPSEDIIGGLEEVLATIGVSTVVQGQESNAVKSEDGRRAGVAVEPLRVTAAPFANFAQGTELEGLKVELRSLQVASSVAAAPAPPPEADTAPDPAPALPHTGGGALAGLLGTMAMGGALALRRRR